MHVPLLLAQHLAIGAKGGLRLTGDVPAYSSSNSRRYLAGPMIEIGLPFRLAFEVGARNSRLGNTFYIPLIANASYIRTIATSREFPLIARYGLPVSRVNPFVSIGIMPRYAAGRINTIQYDYYPSEVTFSSMGWHARDRALVLSGGIRTGTGPFRVMREIRYVRWRVPQTPSSSNASFYLRLPGPPFRMPADHSSR